MVHSIEKEQVFPSFWYFHEWAMHKYGWGESTAGWKNIILNENQNNEELALTKCFELIREFRALKPISIQQSSLDKTNIEFHHSDECKIKRYINPIEQLKGPLYDNANKIYIIEFSHDFGFSIFIRFNDKQIGYDWRNRFKTKEDALVRCQSLFGKPLIWKKLTGDLIKLSNSIIKK